MISVKMTINSEKKHSIRYDAADNNAIITSIYVMKSGLQMPYPQKITVKVEPDA